MQAYGKAFARVYDRHWGGFARHAAPIIREFYEDVSGVQSHKTLLDLCCGTGQLAAHFLERGYRVTGLDLSEHMLSHARRNTLPYVESGQARFVQGDASNFSLDERFGLVVSTFDALNHLDGFDALQRCFACVLPLLVDGGYFVFDLNTRAGLRRWNGISVEDSEELMVVSRGLLDSEGGRAWTRISGFLQVDGGLYERFEDTAFNVAYDLTAVRAGLIETGWASAHFARLEALAAPLDEPEKEGRVFVVARK